METILLRVGSMPDNQELSALLGESLYKYYNSTCKMMTSAFAPDREIWDFAGRRGKYYHGYTVNRLSLSLGMYLEQESLRCELHFYKRYFLRILKKKNSLSTQMQRCVAETSKLNEEYGGAYTVGFFIDGGMLQEMLKMLSIAFPSLEIEYSE